MPCRNNNRRGRAGGIAHTERTAREAGKMDLVILEQMMPEKHLLQRMIKDCIRLREKEYTELPGIIQNVYWIRMHTVIV